MNIQVITPKMDRALANDNINKFLVKNESDVNDFLDMKLAIERGGAIVAGCKVWVGEKELDSNKGKFFVPNNDNTMFVSEARDSLWPIEAKKKRAVIYFDSIEEIDSFTNMIIAIRRAMIIALAQVKASEDSQKLLMEINPKEEVTPKKKKPKTK